MARAIVHIGMPKAGSTAIQAWLAANRDALRARGIVFHPETAAGAGIRHETGIGLIAMEAAGRIVPSRLIRAHLRLDAPADQSALAQRLHRHLAAAIHDAPSATFVLSSEFLAGWLKRALQIRAVDAMLGRHFERVGYVLYLRDQVARVLSAHAQALRGGDDAARDAFVSRRAVCDYNAICLAWSQAVGDRIDIRLTEPDFLAQSDLLADFADRLGVPVGRRPAPSRVNRSPSGPALDLWRGANRVAGRVGARSAMAGLAPIYWRSRLTRIGPRPALTPAQETFVAQANARANAALRARVFPERPVLFARSAAILARTPEVVS